MDDKQEARDLLAIHQRMQRDFRTLRDQALDQLAEVAPAVQAMATEGPAAVRAKLDQEPFDWLCQMMAGLAWASLQLKGHAIAAAPLRTEAADGNN